MSNDFSLSRDLVEELISLVNSGQSFSDIHLEQDMPLMLKTPRGWRQVSAEPVTLEDMVPVLKAIDEDWEDKIIESAIDRPFVLTEYRLRCNVFRTSGGSKVTVSIRRLPLHQRTPIIAMTANVYEDDRQRCIDAGMDAHLAKPIDPKALEQLLRDWLGVPPGG